jgi:hypothetical protein
MLTSNRLPRHLRRLRRRYPGPEGERSFVKQCSSPQQDKPDKGAATVGVAVMNHTEAN